MVLVNWNTENEWTVRGTHRSSQKMGCRGGMRIFPIAWYEYPKKAVAQNTNLSCEIEVSYCRLVPTGREWSHLNRIPSTLCRYPVNMDKFWQAYTSVWNCMRKKKKKKKKRREIVRTAFKSPKFVSRRWPHQRCTRRSGIPTVWKR